MPAIDMSDYTEYQVTDALAMRIDLIAYRTLGDSELWWAIAQVNNIRNPLRDLVAGTILKVPRLDAVMAALAERPTVTEVSRE